MFNFKNINRINKEQDMFKNDKDNIFPLFYAPKQTYKTINFMDDINVYIPTSGDGCYVTKTPCVNGVNGIFAKKNFGFKVFFRKK